MEYSRALERLVELDTISKGIGGDGAVVRMHAALRIADVGDLMSRKNSTEPVADEVVRGIGYIEGLLASVELKTREAVPAGG